MRALVCHLGVETRQVQTPCARPVPGPADEKRRGRWGQWVRLHEGNRKTGQPLLCDVDGFLWFLSHSLCLNVCLSLSLSPHERVELSKEFYNYGCAVQIQQACFTADRNIRSIRHGWSGVWWGGQGLRVLEIWSTARWAADLHFIMWPVQASNVLFWHMMLRSFSYTRYVLSQNSVND